MPYTASIPCDRWRGERRDEIGTIATAHAAIGEVDGPGRPLEIGRPLAHAYVLRVVAAFQAFARDLHALAGERLVELSDVGMAFRPLLSAAVSEGRAIDRGNADLRSLQRDFRRLGIAELNAKLEQTNGHWKKTPRRRGDKAYYRDLIELRNTLAHGNQGQLDELRRRGVTDTVTWTRDRLPGLDRFAGSLDRIVWNHLRSTFQQEPW